MMFVDRVQAMASTSAALTTTTTLPMLGMTKSSLPVILQLLFVQESSSLLYSNVSPPATPVGFCNDSLGQQHMFGRRRCRSCRRSGLSNLHQHQHQYQHSNIDVTGSSRDPELTSSSPLPATHAPSDPQEVLQVRDRSISRVVDRRSLLFHVAPPLLNILATISFPKKNAYADETVSSESSPAATTNTIATTSSNLESRPILTTVKDPDTYEAIVYSPPQLLPTKQQKQPPPTSSSTTSAPPPLIVVLHGAGKNNLPIMDDLGNPNGEHAGLIPSLLVSSLGTTGVGSSDVGTATTGLTAPPPSVLVDNFAVIAPYSYGKQSFYEDPRRKLLDFIDWAIENQNTETLPIRFDPQKIILFGFSDGSTVAVELLTTKRFVAGVVCSYGFSGKQLPPQALERLANIPMWVFHSRDDVIFDVSNSDRLVAQLNLTNRDRSGSVTSRDGGDNKKINDFIRYSRFESDPENLPKRIRGHSMGITASKSPELYNWLLDVAVMNRRGS